MASKASSGSFFHSKAGCPGTSGFSPGDSNTGVFSVISSFGFDVSAIFVFIEISSYCSRFEGFFQETVELIGLPGNRKNEDHRQIGLKKWKRKRRVIAKEERLKQSSTLRDGSMPEDCFGRPLRYPHSLAMTFLFPFFQSNLS